MFDKASLLRRYHYRLQRPQARQTLRTSSGEDSTLGSENLKTLLLMILRNATTDSPWPLSNNPRALYNDPSRADNNLAIPLWRRRCRPVRLRRRAISTGGGDGGSAPKFVFVDGGLTMYNNPAFHLFLMATLDEVPRLGWPATESDLLLVSVGTGVSPPRRGVTMLRAWRGHQPAVQRQFRSGCADACSPDGARPVVPGVWPVPTKCTDRSGAGGLDQGRTAAHQPPVQAVSPLSTLH